MQNTTFQAHFKYPRLNPETDTFFSFTQVMLESTFREGEKNEKKTLGERKFVILSENMIVEYVEVNI